MQEKRESKINVLEIVLGVILLLHAAVLIVLIAWALFNSMKAPLAFDLDPVLISQKMLDSLEVAFNKTGTRINWFKPENYVAAFKGITQRAKIDGKYYNIYLPEMFLNSLVYAVGCAFFATLVPCLVAYVTSKYKFRFNDVVYGIVIFAMVTPIVGNQPSSIQMAKRFGFFDSHVGLWFMSATFLGTYYLVFHAIFKGLSWEYAEAAFMDGASHATVMFQVMFPLVKTTFFVVMLMNFIAYWNDYQRPWIYLPNHPTAAVGIQFCVSGGMDNKYAGGIPVMLAGGMIMLLPVMTLFIVFRDKFVGNLTVGGIKG